MNREAKPNLANLSGRRCSGSCSIAQIIVIGKVAQQQGGVRQLYSTMKKVSEELIAGGGKHKMGVVLIDIGYYSKGSMQREL